MEKSNATGVAVSQSVSTVIGNADAQLPPGTVVLKVTGPTRLDRLPPPQSA